MKIQPLIAAACLALCATTASADQRDHPTGSIALQNLNPTTLDDAVDLSDVVNFLFLAQFLERYYGVSTEDHDPLELNPLSIEYVSNDDPDAFDVDFTLD